MKPLVIYHANCADGFGAAYAAWLKLGDEAEYLPMNYGETYNFDLSGIVIDHVGHEINGREVFILDFSFPREVMDDIFTHAKRVVWLDHHKTAFEMWCGGYRKGDSFQAIPLGGADPLKHYIILDDNFSGAYLAWEYFHPGADIPTLIQHIDDRDRWQFKMRCSKEVHTALSSYKPWSFAQWDELMKPMHYATIITEGSAVLRAHNQHVQDALKQARECHIDYGQCTITEQHIGLAANAPAFLASDLGHELANKSSTFGLVWSMVADGQVNCSLRSNGDYDVSAIAKAFGGGGHRNAAGFSTNIETLVSWLA